MIFSYLYLAKPETKSIKNTNLIYNSLDPKVKFVKAEKTHTIKNIPVFNLKKRLDNNQNKFLSITQYLINGHHAKLRKIKQQEEEQLKDKEKLLLEELLNNNKKQNFSKMSRKTEILLVDSDGDIIVGTEDELGNCFTETSQKPIYNKKISYDKNNSNDYISPEFNQIGKSLNDSEVELNIRRFERNDDNNNVEKYEKLYNELRNDSMDNKQGNKNNIEFMRNQNTNKKFIVDNIVLKLLDEPQKKFVDAFKSSIINFSDISDAINLIENLYNNKIINEEKKALYIDKLENLLDLFTSLENKSCRIVEKDETYILSPNKQCFTDINDINSSNQHIGQNKVVENESVVNQHCKF